jgi:hypothetical protein
MTDRTDLAELTGRLEQAAERLRAGDLDPAAAAELIDECARLAAAATSELEHSARRSEPAPGQDSLL